MPPPPSVIFDPHTNSSVVFRDRTKRLVRGTVLHSPGENSLHNFLVIRGGPSVNKSFSVEEALEECGIEPCTTLPNARTLPEMLHECSYHPTCVLLLDDADHVLSSSLLDTLRHVTEIGKRRLVSYTQTKPKLSKSYLKAKAKAEAEGEDFDEELTPPPFNFDGSIIIISNIVPAPSRPTSKVWQMYPRAIQPKVEALLSRAVILHVRPSFEDQYHYAGYSVACREGVIRIRHNIPPVRLSQQLRSDQCPTTGCLQTHRAISISTSKAGSRTKLTSIRPPKCLNSRMHSARN